MGLYSITYLIFVNWLDLGYEMTWYTRLVILWYIDIMVIVNFTFKHINVYKKKLFFQKDFTLLLNISLSVVNAVPQIIKLHVI